MAIKSSPLTHASVGTVRSWVLDNPSGLDNVDSCDILKALFGIPGQQPTPVSITEKLCNAAGDIEFRNRLINKNVKGDIWCFTSDFGVTAVVTKVKHEPDGKFTYEVAIKYADEQDGSTVNKIRPLVEYDARGVKYFDITDTKGDNYDDHLEDVVQDVQQGQTATTEGIDQDTGDTSTESVEDQEPAVEHDVEDFDRESSTLTDLDDIDDDDESEDVTVEHFNAFATSLVDCLKKNGTISDNNLISGFELAFPGCKVDIDRVNCTEAGKLSIHVTDNGKEYHVMVNDWIEKPVAQQPVAPDPIVTEPTTVKEDTPEQQPVKAEETPSVKEEPARVENNMPVFTGEIDDDYIEEPEDDVSEERFNKFTLNLIDQLRESGEISDANIIEDFDLLFRSCRVVIDHDHPAEDGKIFIHVWSKHKVYHIAVDEWLPPKPVVQQQSEPVNKLSEATCCIDTNLRVREHNRVINKAYEALRSGRITDLEQLDSELTSFIGDSKSVITHLDDNDVIHITVEDIPEETHEQVEVTEPTTDPVVSEPEQEEAPVTEQGQPDEPVTETEDVHEEVQTPDESKEEEVTDTSAEELQEAMMEDKTEDPVTVDPDYIDLSDQSVRDRVIQVLFPGITDPAITHLLNFLRDYHTSEETRSFVETKGTLPTETCIVYTNLTFSIVKMKDGRYWRIFCANTDCGLDDPTWLTTKYVPNRWYQLGHDISNTTDYVRDTCSAWRRKNNNF